MGIRKTIIKYNPICFFIKKKERARLKQNVTILASNCIGGMLSHDYGLQFLSPTVNTRFDSPDFVKFITRLDYYLNQPFHFIPENEKKEPFPVAWLDDIKVYFVHYHTDEEAEAKWRERVKRIDRHNCFILTNDKDGMTESDFTALDNCEFRNILVITAKKWPCHRCTFQVKKYANQNEVGNAMTRSLFTGRMGIQKNFDLVAWFNQDKGELLENYRLI